MVDKGVDAGAGSLKPSRRMSRSGPGAAALETPWSLHSNSICMSREDQDQVKVTWTCESVGKPHFSSIH